jgi:iturin family lipopeptide synthetase A
MDRHLKPAAVLAGGEPAPPRFAAASLGDILRHSAAMRASGTITYLEGDTESRITYAALLARAESVQRMLMQSALAHGDPVILQVESPHELVPVFWGCVLAGITPIITPVAAQALRAAAAEDVVQIGVRLGAAAILADAASQPFLKDPCRKAGLGLLSSEIPIDGHETPPSGPSSSAATAFIQLTSGSSGQSKSVYVSHQNILSAVWESSSLAVFEHGPSLCWTSLTHITSLVWHIRETAFGRAQVIARPEAFTRDPLRWLDWLSDYSVALTRAPNFALAHVVRALERSSHRAWRLDPIRSVVLGGEPINIATCESFLNALAPFGLQRSVLFAGYGLSESTGGVTYVPVACGSAGTVVSVGRGVSVGDRVRRASRSAEHARHFVSVGVPMGGTVVRVVGKDGVVVEPDVVGHIEISGPTIARCVRRSGGTTSAHLREDWLVTGDTGFVSDNGLVVTGRANDVSVVRGQQISVADVEALISNIDAVDDTRMCAIVSRRRRVDAEQVVVVFAVKPHRQTDGEQVAAEVARLVSAHFGFQPEVIPIPGASFPITDSGKIGRAELQAMVDAGQFTASLQH